MAQPQSLRPSGISLGRFSTKCFKTCAGMVYLFSIVLFQSLLISHCTISFKHTFYISFSGQPLYLIHVASHACITVFKLLATSVHTVGRSFLCSSLVIQTVIFKRASYLSEPVLYTFLKFFIRTLFNNYIDSRYGARTSAFFNKRLE